MLNTLSVETASAPQRQSDAAKQADLRQHGAAFADPLKEPRVQRLLLSLAIGFGLVAFVFAFGDVLRSFDYAETIRTLRRLPGDKVAIAVAAALLSYASFVGREGRRLPMSARRFHGWPCGSAPFPQRRSAMSRVSAR